MDKYRSLREQVTGCKGVVFDLDGTLVDLNVDWNELKKKLAELTKKQTGEDIEYTPLDQKIYQAKERFGQSFFSQLLELISQFELHEEKYVLNHELISLFESLRDKKVAIYSMNTGKCVRNFVEKYLKRNPDNIVSKDDCLEPKPSDKDLKKILDEWGFAPQEVLYIGNSENDRLSGEKVGIETLIITM